MDFSSELKKQLQESLSNPDYLFSCCGLKFEALYLFRQHVYEHHRDIYDGVFADFHREAPVSIVPPRCPQRKRPGYKPKSKGPRQISSLSPYKTNRPPNIYTYGWGGEKVIYLAYQFANS